MHKLLKKEMRSICGGRRLKSAKELLNFMVNNPV